MARPRKEIDFKMVEQLAAIMCTQEEIASVLGVSVDTLKRRPGFAEASKKGRDMGKTSLRRYQFVLAKKSAAMGIFLGKQYLGQTDKPDIEAELQQLKVFVGIIVQNIQKVAPDAKEAILTAAESQCIHTGLLPPV